MTHDQVVAEIQRRARLRGVLTHYCGHAERCSGDPGITDLILAGQHGTAWIEVKTPACPDLSSGQSRWKWMLRASGQVHEVMYEHDLEPGGAADMMIGFLATGEAR